MFSLEHQSDSDCWPTDRIWLVLREIQQNVNFFEDFFVFSLSHTFQRKSNDRYNLIRDVHIQTTIRERFWRKINNFCKRNHPDSQKILIEVSFRQRLFTDWPEFHEIIQQNINFGVIFGYFLSDTFSAKIKRSVRPYPRGTHWKNHWRMFFEENK